MAAVVAGEEAGAAGLGRSCQQDRTDCLGSSRPRAAVQPISDQRLLTAVSRCRPTQELVTAERDAR